MLVRVARRALQTTGASSSRIASRNIASADETYEGLMSIVKETTKKEKQSNNSVPKRPPHGTPPINSDYKSPTVQTFIRPYDLSKEAMLKRPRPRLPREGPGRKDALRTDPFLSFGIDPRSECENATLLRDYVSDMGKILPRAQTGLSQRSQRLMGKAIKRAKMMGIIPMFSKGKGDTYYN